MTTTPVITVCFVMLCLLALAIPAQAQFALISHGPISGACNPHTLGLDDVDNVVYSCGGQVGRVPAQWAALGGATACPTCILAPGGNAAIAGTFTMQELITSGLGAANVVGSYGTLSVAPASTTMFGFGPGDAYGNGAGTPVFSTPADESGVVIPFAYQDGFGNVLQPALTAAALAATPAQCSGEYATGVAANGNANCSTSTYVLIPEIAAPTGVSGYGIWYADSTAHVMKFIDPAYASGAAQYPLFKANNYAAWGPCPIAGTTAITQYCSWTLPAGITIVSMDVMVNALPGTTTGCSTYAVIDAQDVTAGAPITGFSITLSVSNSFLNVTPTAVAVAAGHVVSFKVATAAAGCTPNAGNVTATITYQMS